MIPKIVHVSWKSKDVVNSQSPLILNGLRNLIDLNPDWDIQISTDMEVDSYLFEALEKEHYDLVKNIGIVPQTDIWRLLKLYNEGGVYVDIDRLCNKPLDNLIDDDNVKWVVPTCGDTDFSHDFMMTAPENPAILNTMKLYFDRRKQGNDNVYYLGPVTYMHGVTLSLFGEITDPNPGKEKFDQIRDRLNNQFFIRTYKESLPGNSVIYSGDTSWQEWADMKKSFYAENGIKHWTGEW